MANVLSDDKKQQVVALGRLGWSLRRIEESTGVRRETASAYLKQAGLAVRPPGRWGRDRAKPANEVITGSDADVAAVGPSNPANEVITGSDADVAAVGPSNPANEVITGSGGDVAAVGRSKPANEVITGSVPGRSPSASACEPYRELIEAALGRGRNAMAIYQDLVDEHGFAARYASVLRYVRKVAGARPVEAKVVIQTAPGQEAQVDYGEGPMVRDPETRKYRRTRLFVMTLGYSRKAVRLLVFKSSSRTWAELHEQAFRRLGGVTQTVVLDNLREGVLHTDVYEPTLNPLYSDVLRHYGVVALPCRVRDPDRKGKVESSIGHTQKTPIKGLRFETLAEAQAYLDRWDENWADKRIHGTTKRQVAAMFAEEKPSLRPLPIEPFRYYEYGTRTVHLDGHVEVQGAYYAAPPGIIGARLPVQWDGQRVRILDGRTGQLLREHVVQRPGGYRTPDEDKPKRTPSSTLHLLARAARAGKHVGALCERIHRDEGETGVRRMLGMLSLVKKHGAPTVDAACATALEMELPTYRFVRRYVERRIAPQLSLLQVDPLIRELTQYRDLIQQITKEPE